VTVARRSAKLSRGGRKAVRLHLGRRAVRALRRTGHRRLAVVAAGIVGGTHAGATKRVRLTRHR
jgi:hypothetical protein